MNKKNIALGLVLKKLNAFSLDSFRDRLLLQKKIFLAQKLGVDLGYRYSWYLKGPYSTDLTEKAYEIIPESNIPFDDFDLTKDIKEKLKEVNRLVNLKKRKEAKLDEPDWYELLASLIYLYDSDLFVPSNGKQEINNFLLNHKPKYTKEQCNYAWEALEEEGWIGDEE